MRRSRKRRPSGSTGAQQGAAQAFPFVQTGGANAPVQQKNQRFSIFFWASPKAVRRCVTASIGLESAPNYHASGQGHKMMYDGHAEHAARASAQGVTIRRTGEMAGDGISVFGIENSEFGHIAAVSAARNSQFFTGFLADVPAVCPRRERRPREAARCRMSALSWHARAGALVLRMKRTVAAAHGVQGYVSVAT